METSLPPSDEEKKTTVTIQRWRCPNCGQLIFTNYDETPPDICDYCHDMTTWKRLDS